MRYSISHKIVVKEADPCLEAGAAAFQRFLNKEETNGLQKSA
jgi:hypothetical protein